MNFSGKITGVSATLLALGALPNAVRNKVARPALREGAKVVKKQASLNVKSQVSDEATGLLAKSFVVKSLKMRNKNIRVAVAISNKISIKGVRAGLYGSVFELGKEDQEPRPSLRPALRETQGETNAAIVRVAKLRLPAAIEAAKRGRK